MKKKMKLNVVLFLIQLSNEMFCAEKGNGAYLNNSRIRVSKKKKIKDALIVTGGPKGASKIKIKFFQNILMFQKMFLM